MNQSASSIRFDLRVGLKRWLILLVGLAPLFAMAGCQSSAESDSSDIASEPKVQHAVNVVVVDADDLVEPLKRQWEAETGGELHVKSVTTTELFADDYAAIDGVDVLLYPSLLLAHLVTDERISVLPDEVWNSEKLDNKGFLKECRSRMIRFGRDRWGTPISNPYQLMFVRTDVSTAVGFDDSSSLDTWAQLLEFQRALKNLGGDSNMPTRIAIPTADQHAAYSLLLIAAAEVRHRGKLDVLFERSTMKPLINSPPFIDALSTLKTLVGDQEELNSSQSANLFFTGDAAVAIGSPRKASLYDADGSQMEVSDLVFEMTSVGELPGSTRWFEFKTDSWNEVLNPPARVSMVGSGGLQASILTTASYPTQVYEFISWLSSKSATSKLVSGSEFGAPTRYGQLGDLQAWTGDVLNVENSDRYIELVTEINEYDIVMRFPRIMGSHEYLSALADGVRQCLDTNNDEASALKTVAERWETITEKYGRSKQIDLLRTDLGF